MEIPIELGDLYTHDFNFTISPWKPGVFPLRFFRPRLPKTRIIVPNGSQLRNGHRLNGWWLAYELGSGFSGQ